MLTDEQLKVLNGESAKSDDNDASDTSIVISPLTSSIGSLDLNGMTTISIPTISNSYYGAGATVGGISTTSTTPWSGSGYTYSINNTSGYTINSSPSTVSISTSGIDMAAGTDLKIDGQSLKEFMKKMEQRLAILVPDPKKLEKFQALQKAYDHYKTMESLCFDEPEEEKK